MHVATEKLIVRPRDSFAKRESLTELTARAGNEATLSFTILTPPQ